MIALLRSEPWIADIESYVASAGLSVVNLAEIASEIYSTAGSYDLLAKFYIDAEGDIGHFVNEKVQTIPGVRDTYTIITFRAF